MGNRVSEGLRFQGICGRLFIVMTSAGLPDVASPATLYITTTSLLAKGQEQHVVWTGREACHPNHVAGEGLVLLQRPVDTRPVRPNGRCSDLYPLAFEKKR